MKRLFGYFSLSIIIFLPVYASAGAKPACVNTADRKPFCEEIRDYNKEEAEKLEKDLQNLKGRDPKGPCKLKEFEPSISDAVNTCTGLLNDRSKLSPRKCLRDENKEYCSDIVNNYRKSFDCTVRTYPPIFRKGHLIPNPACSNISNSLGGCWIRTCSKDPSKNPTTNAVCAKLVESIYDSRKKAAEELAKECPPIQCKQLPQQQPVVPDPFAAKTNNSDSGKSGGRSRGTYSSGLDDIAYVPYSYVPTDSSNEVCAEPTSTPNPEPTVLNEPTVSPDPTAKPCDSNGSDGGGMGGMLGDVGNNAPCEQ
jgi:hypothetical protein